MTEKGAPPTLGGGANEGGSLGGRAARGVAITLGGQGAKILIQVASVVVLARLLTPHDYGLIAMVIAVIGIGEIFRDFGLSSAASQAKTLSLGQRTNLFWINTGIGLVLSIAVYLGAGVISLVYNEDEVIPLAHALAVTFLLNGLATQYRADLVRNLRFAALARADVVAPALGLVAGVTGALLGWGYWALVAQQLSQSVALLVMLAISARWMPRLPRRGEPMRGFLTFGGHLVTGQLIGYVSNNIDYVLIGRLFGPAQLGLYNRAFQLLMTPLSQIRSPLTTVALPVLSKLADDPRRYSEYISRAQLALGYTIVAGLGIVAAAAEPITRVFLGEQWLSVIPILRLLAIAGILQMLTFVGYWVYVSRGLTKQLVQYTTVSAVIKIVCIVIGARWGVVGVAVGYTIAPALSWPLSFWWLSRLTEIPTRRLYTGALRILALVAIAGSAAWAAALWLAAAGSVAQIAIAAAVVAAVYVLATLVLPPVRRDVAGVVAMAKMIRSR